MHAWQKMVFIGISVTCLAWSISVISKSMKDFTEPNPTKYDPDLIKTGLQSAGIEVDVLRVIYVNRDSTTYIFEGKVRKVDKSIWNPIKNGWVRNPNGVIFVHQNLQTSFVGYNAGSTISNLKPFFGQHWKDLVK